MVHGKMRVLDSKASHGREERFNVAVLLRRIRKMTKTHENAQKSTVFRRESMLEPVRPTQCTAEEAVDDSGSLGTPRKPAKRKRHLGCNCASLTDLHFARGRRAPKKSKLRSGATLRSAL